MWKEGSMKPIKMGMLNRYYSLYRCPNCGSMFSSVIQVTGYDIIDSPPNYCPECRVMFVNNDNSDK